MCATCNAVLYQNPYTLRRKLDFTLVAKGTPYSLSVTTATINYNKTFTWSKSTSAANKTVTVSIQLKNANDPTTSIGTATVSFSVTVPALASYAVKYAANGGSSTPSQQTKYYGQSLTLAAAISHANTTPTSYKVTYNYNGNGQAATSATANVTRTWTFSKWKASDGTQYNGGGSYTANAATTMTAQWTTSDTTAQLTLPTPNARTGYTFAGWYTAATGGTSKGAAGAKFTPTAATTLYAHWTGVSYTVSFNANGGTGAPSSQTRVHGTALKLSTTAPTRIGHTFLGWATTASAGAAQYAPGASYNPTAAGNSTLYAVWKSNYAAPKITSLTAVRCNSAGTADDEGTYAKVTAKWSTMQSIDQGKTANYGTVTGKTRASGTSTDVSFTFSSGAGGSGVYSGTATAIVPSMSTEKSYTVTVTVRDAQGATSTVRSTVLTASKFILDFASGGNGIGIGEAAPSSGLAIGKDVTLHGSLEMTGTMTIRKALPGVIMYDNAMSTRIGQTGSPTYTGRIYSYDSNNEIDFYTETTLLEDGRTQRSFVSRRYSANGATQYNNGFYLGIDASGNPYVSFTTGGRDAWMTGLNALPLSGGTMNGTLSNTGSFIYKNNSLDRDGAAPSGGEDLWGGGVYFQDKDGDNWAYLRPVHRANGRHDVQLAVFDQNGLANGFQISRNNGVNSYWMSDAPAFREAIGITKTKTTYNATQAASTVFDSITSGVTVSNVYTAKWGEVMTIQFTFSYNAVRNNGAALTIGTLKSGFRPAYLVGGGSYTWAGYISNAGVLAVRNVSGAQVAANASSSIGFTYVLA